MVSLISKIGTMLKTTGSSTKGNFLKTAKMEKENCIFQTDKSLKVISKKIWCGVME